MTRHTARTVCDPNCHANPKCGLTATIEDGRIIAVDTADYPTPEFENRICQMGRSRLEYQYHPDRLRTPMKRVGERGENKWEAISWDEAATLFADNHKRIAEQYGSKAVAFTSVSGSFSLLNRGGVSRYAALTDATVTSPSSAFDVGVPKGLEYMFGMPATSYFIAGGHEFADAVNSDVILIWGLNAAVTRSMDHSPLKEARKTGTKLICIDPTRSETAGWSDEWISPRPGTDGALALAMVHWIIENDKMDKGFVIDRTDMPFLVKASDGSLLREKDLVVGGGDEAMVWCGAANAPVLASNASSIELSFTGNTQTADGASVELHSVFTLYQNMVASFTPEATEEITGIPASTITQLASEYANAKPGAIRVGYGIDRYYYADTTARSIALLACLTGNIGIAGGGMSLMEGAKFAPARGRNIYAPDGKYPTVLTFQEIDSAVRKGVPYPIKMECISLGNPYIMAKPGYGNKLQGYVDQLEFITVIDHFITDTAKLADLVLPACTIFERTDINIDRLVQLQQPVVEPEGEAKPDFEIFGLFAEKMGCGEYFSESLEYYVGRVLDLGDEPTEETSSDSSQADDMSDPWSSGKQATEKITLERLLKEKVIDPFKGEEPFYGFKDLKFPTASGRVECYKEELRPYGSEIAVFREPIEASPNNPLFEKYPLVLLSAHSRNRIHSTFANLDALQRKEPEPLVRINPIDASSRSISEGSVVEVYNDRGAVKIKCLLDDKIRTGTALIEEGHWVDQFIEGNPYSLLHDHINPTNDNYFHYDVLVEVKSV